MNYISWFVLYFIECICWLIYGMSRWRSWLEHCATSQKVVGSIPNGVTDMFRGHNPSGRIMALG